jgi:BirA family biotin operon repressor/biotin-[acetyl-CoA-carboxylase] ligase
MAELSPENVQKQLSTLYIGRAYHFFETLPSTMDEAVRLARENAPEGATVLAEEQTQGRGRFQRAWVSPRGENLLFSIVLRPTLKVLPKINMASSLAVARVMKRLYDLDCSIKWPNDVLLNGKKLSGILMQVHFTGDTPDFAILGIGLNVNFDPRQHPEVAELATSLALVLGSKVPRLPLLATLLLELEQLYEVAKHGDPIHQVWRRYLETLGRHIKVNVGDHVEEGVAEDVQEDGSLVLRRPDGQVLALAQGEVTLRI